MAQRRISVEASINKTAKQLVEHNQQYGKTDVSFQQMKERVRGATIKSEKQRARK